MFAIADGDRPRSYGFDPPGPVNSFRRPSTGSESSSQGSFASVPELSRPSTASPSPRLVPSTPETHHTIAPGDKLHVNLRLSCLQDELQCLQRLNKSILYPARGRRSSSRQAPYSTATSNRGRRGGGQPGKPPRGKQQKKKPHFNLRYPKSVKLFILYHKEDCGWGWKAINRRRVELLPVLYRGGYKPEIEENREVAGINGFYYRLNEVMPALTHDGSGLRFVEHGGRSWELTEPSKCRGGAPCRGQERRKGGGKAKEDAEPRPRGMVDRYPEEVVYHWDEFVKHFVQPAKHAEVLARAKANCKCCPHTHTSPPPATRTLSSSSLFMTNHPSQPGEDVADDLSCKQARSALSKEGKRAYLSGLQTTRTTESGTRTRPTRRPGPPR